MQKVILLLSFMLNFSYASVSYIAVDDLNMLYTNGAAEGFVKDAVYKIGSVLIEHQNMGFLFNQDEKSFLLKGENSTVKLDVNLSFLDSMKLVELSALDISYKGIDTSLSFDELVIATDRASFDVHTGQLSARLTERKPGGLRGVLQNFLNQGSASFSRVRYDELSRADFASIIAGSEIAKEFKDSAVVKKAKLKNIDLNIKSRVLRAQFILDSFINIKFKLVSMIDYDRENRLLSLELRSVKAKGIGIKKLLLRYLRKQSFENVKITGSRIDISL